MCVNYYFLVIKNFEKFFKKHFLFKIWFIFLTVSFFLKNENIYNKLYLTLSLIIIFLFIDSVYQFLYFKNIFGFIAIDHPRISSVFGEEYILGSYVVSFPLLIACHFYCYNNISKMKYMTSITFIYLCNYFSFWRKNGLTLRIYGNIFIIIFIIKNLKLKFIYFYQFYLFQF